MNCGLESQTETEKGPFHQPTHPHLRVHVAGVGCEAVHSQGRGVVALHLAVAEHLSKLDLRLWEAGFGGALDDLERLGVLAALAQRLPTHG